jgi:hypothetical protein
MVECKPDENMKIMARSEMVVLIAQSTIRLRESQSLRSRADPGSTPDSRTLASRVSGSYTQGKGQAK